MISKTKFLVPFLKAGEHSSGYKIYKCLAIGGFSKVYLARSYEDGRFYAIKFMKKAGLSEEERKEKRNSIFN